MEQTAGGTRLTCCIEQDLSPLFEQDAALVGQTVQQHLESDLLRLKKVVESR